MVRPGLGPRRMKPTRWLLALVVAVLLQVPTAPTFAAGGAQPALTYLYDAAPGLTTPDLSAHTAALLARVTPQTAPRSSTSSISLMHAAKGARGVDQGFAVGAGFRSFSQFKRVLGPAGQSKQWHHLVEQTPGNVARYGPQAIHNTGNVVRLDTAVHRQVSGYFSSKQAFTGGQTVRQWLSSQSYARQQQFARQVLERFGG